ncbi:MAG: PSD1 domain-containing protein [Verrucomicrobiae bacterium]|nr:PSD1 domain-containing protein [Verrucomicrobiae bacterium]
MNWRSRSRILLLASLAGMGHHARADDFFSTNIAPLLEKKCFECHSHRQKIKGGLTLDSRSGWEQGGDSGPAVLPGHPEASLLIKMVRWTDEDHQMPPKEKLSSGEIAQLVEWVRRGAPDPRILEVTRPSATDWWSLKPLVKPALPAIPGEPHPVDAFIRSRLAGLKIAPSPEADRRTLIRRLCFDLHGLPPTPDEVERFVHDADPRAYERLVDNLLESPRYGERWARHWLDTIHFAETHGCSHDLPRDHAWRYRDYVIQSFNEDKPWSRFIREQLAADCLFPEEPRLITALGFLGAGVFDHSAYQTAPTNFDYLDRDDLVTQTMGAFTSTTANCARCHAHKFDPITQEDYYSLQAVFAGVIEGDVGFDEDPGVAGERLHWQALITAAEAQDKSVLFQPDILTLVEAWEKRRGPSLQWTPLDIETFTSQEGAALTREGRIIISGGARPDKDTYVVTTTATANASRMTGLRLDVLADPSLPQGGPGRQDNGNLTLTGIGLELLNPDGSPMQNLPFARASADFDQQGWTSAMAIDGKEGTGWGIHPEEGRSHHAVFALAEPVLLTPGTRLRISLQQHSGRSHLIGRFSLSVTGAAEPGAGALPQPAEQALAMRPEQRNESQRLAVAASGLRQIATQALEKLPARSFVYGAAKHADVLLAVGKGTPTTVTKPKVVEVLQRGEFDKPKGQAVSGALSAVTALASRFPKAHAGDESERRAALADWLADPANPLTWRSIANRVWQHHFGRGICDSPNDFGRMGGDPSHPELLDWLACELRDHTGSLKHLHRLIVTSSAYRQTSEDRGDAATLDGDNRLLWRMNRRRLDADSYRDFVLAASGRLDLRMGGPGDRQFITGPPVQLTPTLNYEAFDWASQPGHRRSIYRFVWRGVPDPFMDALDFPDLGMLAPVRGFSASPLQALALYNNPFVLHFSSALGSQLNTPEEAVRRLLLREATTAEAAAFGTFADRNGLAALCRVLLNSNEFLFVN